MAKQAWNTVSKTSGTGNDTFTTAGSVHTGRSSRSSTNTVAAEGATSVEVAVTQSAAGNILTLNTTGTIAKTATSITVTGKSNTSKLTFAISGIGFSISNPQISIEGTLWENITSGTAIPTDPGTKASYAFRITVTVTANPTVATRSATLTVTPAEGSAKTLTLTQAAGDPTLSVSPVSVTIPAAGTAQTVTVTSNTDWTVS